MKSTSAYALALGLVAGAAGWVARGALTSPSERDPSLHPAEERHAAAIPETSAVVPPASVAIVAPPVEATMAERAARGELAAMKSIELLAPQERTVELALALAEGHATLAREEVRVLGRDVERAPELWNDPTTLAKLRAWSLDAETSAEALKVLAGSTSPIAADVTYDVMVDPTARSGTRMLAEDLLLGPTMRSEASPALAAALDLRSKKQCWAIAPLLPRIERDADERALATLDPLTSMTGCGSKRDEDCYACLRDDEALDRAIAAAKARPAPRPWAARP